MKSCRLPDRNAAAPAHGENGRKKRSFGRRLKGIDKLLIVDIDNTLVGDDSSMQRAFRDSG